MTLGEGGMSLRIIIILEQIKCSVNTSGHEVFLPGSDDFGLVF